MAEEPLYNVVKFTVRELVSKTYTLLCIIVPKGKSSVERFEALVSQSPDTAAITSTDSYKDCANRIQKLILGGYSSQSSTQSMVNYFKNAFASESFMVEFIHYIDKEEDDKLKVLLLQYTSKILGRGDYDANLYVNQFTREELEATSSNYSKDKSSSRDIKAKSIPDEALIVNFQFVLSPVTGTSVSELKKGDQILLKIVPDSDRINEIINQFGLRDEQGGVNNCIGTVTELIFHKDKSVETIAQITDEVYGTYIEEEPEVRVKLAEPSIISVGIDDDVYLKETFGNNERNWIIPAAIIVGVIILLWVFVAFFIV